MKSDINFVPVEEMHTTRASQGRRKEFMEQLVEQSGNQIQQPKTSNQHTYE